MTTTRTTTADTDLDFCFDCGAPTYALVDAIDMTIAYCIDCNDENVDGYNDDDDWLD